MGKRARRAEAHCVLTLSLETGTWKNEVRDDDVVDDEDDDEDKEEDGGDKEDDDDEILFCDAVEGLTCKISQSESESESDEDMAFNSKQGIFLGKVLLDSSLCFEDCCSDEVFSTTLFLFCVSDIAIVFVVSFIFDSLSSDSFSSFVC